MANPQKENGYTPIANELLEALARIRISGEARQILDVIIRKTYGFNKPDDPISLSQFRLATGLHKSAVCKGLLKLKELNLITQKVTSIASSYSINKDFDTWKPLPKRRHQSPKGKSGSHQKVNQRNPKGDIQKTLLQKTITKDTSTNVLGQSPDKRNPEVQELWDYGLSLEFSNNKQLLNRYAITRLLKGKTVEQLKKAARFSQDIRAEAYAPQVNNWLDLEEKYLKLRDWVVRQQAKAPPKGRHIAL